jgi:two-component system, NtrC family, sensor kinase
MRHKDLIPTLALVTGWFAAMAVVVWLVVDGRATTLERGMRDTAALAEVMEQHTARTFQSALLVSRGVADGWWFGRPRRHDPGFQEVLRSRLADLPQASALFIVDADGRVIHDSNYPRTPDTSFADRPYFQAYRDDPTLKTGIFGPIVARTPGIDWFVAATARLGPRGEFRGVVGAAVERASFEELYAKMPFAASDVIALFHHDGTLIARHPAAGADVGRSFSQLPMFGQLPERDSVSYRGPGQMFPGKRIVSYRAVQGLPLVVYISRDEHAVLAEWRRSAIGAAVAMGALTLLLAGVLYREMRRRRRRELERARRTQAEKLEALGQLTGGIAHDFGNLLGVISNSLHLLAMKDAQSTPQAIDMARRAVNRGREMVDRLLAFARRQPLQIGPADLNSLVTQAHPLLAQAVGSRVELVLRLAPGLPPILTDESQFEMAVLNLVVNARDALGGRGRIVLRTHAEPTGDACLSVEDGGPGMPEEVRRRAVEPFYSTKGEAGTGLGLAQVYGFMQQIGGALDIESAPGKGTRVHLRFAAAHRKVRATAPQ